MASQLLYRGIGFHVYPRDIRYSGSQRAFKKKPLGILFKLNRRFLVALFLPPLIAFAVLGVSFLTTSWLGLDFAETPITADKRKIKDFPKLPSANFFYPQDVRQNWPSLKM